MRETDHKFINQVKRTHAKVTDKVMELFLRCGVPPTEIQHIFLGANDDEYILWGKTGYHIAVDWDGDGKVTCEARPGEFMASTAGPLWVNRVTGFHRTIGNSENLH